MTDLRSGIPAENIRLTPDGCAVRILDQSQLPGRTVYLELRGADELKEAIVSLRVRGAPAIGIFAAYALYVLAGQIDARDYDDFYAQFSAYRKDLDSARPTAVNLHAMLMRMDAAARSLQGEPPARIPEALKAQAEAIQEEDKAMCRAISEYGLSLVREGSGVLTHCNAGPLATSLYGTAQGPFILAAERGIRLRAFCDETRPLLQGARLTSYELSRAGVDCTLICDNMASAVMKNGWIDACFVGCDRMAANGDAANKIGTCGVAILARHYGIPFYVLLPSSTIDFSCATGDDIKIEQRSCEEIRSLYFKQPIAPEGVKCYNPAFDVTGNDLITAIVTERGICYPPYPEAFRRLFPERTGQTPSPGPFPVTDMNRAETAVSGDMRHREGNQDNGSEECEEPG